MHPGAANIFLRHPWHIPHVSACTCIAYGCVTIWASHTFCSHVCSPFIEPFIGSFKVLLKALLKGASSILRQEMHRSPKSTESCTLPPQLKEGCPHTSGLVIIKGADPNGFIIDTRRVTDSRSPGNRRAVRGLQFSKLGH